MSKTTNSTGKPTFALTLQAVPGWGNVPATIRLKRFLKAALRGYGLRCTEARDYPRQPGADGPARQRPRTENNPRPGRQASTAGRPKPEANEGTP